MGSGSEERKGTDIHKLPSLNTLTRLGNEAVQKGDLQKALKYFEDAVEKAKSEKDTKVKVSCCLNAGACLVSLNQHKRGLLILEQAIAVIKSDDDTQTMEVSADVFYNAATAACVLKEFEKAVSYFTASVELYERLDSKEHAAETLESLACCHRDARDVEKQITCLVRAQQLYNARGNYAAEALVDVELAKAYQSVKKFDTCKQMLDAAHALSSKLDSPSMKGKLGAQLGLVYTSMAMLDNAIRSFEQALPLVRDVLPHEEASVLQNMGAVYNEKGLYSDSLVYHKKAAALHGKNNSHNSEAKCLCNLAVAESHLGDYSAAKTSYLNAYKQAEAVGNCYLQFQASEGLGSLCIQTNNSKDAIHYLKQALKTLDEIKQDTGMARERVMEKLSDAMEALHKNDAHQRGTTTSSDSTSPEDHPHNLPGCLETCPPALPVISVQNASEKNTTTDVSRKSAEFASSLPVPAKKATVLLPPIRSPIQTLADSTDVSTPQGPSKAPTHKVAITRRKKKRLSTMNEVPEAYEQQLDAYVDSINNDPSPASSSDTNLSGNGDHSDHMLGASVFSRYASKSPKLGPFPGKPLLTNGEAVPRSPSSVGEGSLAIGPNARDLYTTGQTVVETESKRGKPRVHVRTEIVRVGSESHCQSTVPEAKGQGAAHSKVCLIL